MQQVCAIWVSYVGFLSLTQCQSPANGSSPHTNPNFAHNMLLQSAAPNAAPTQDQQLDNKTSQSFNCELQVLTSLGWLHAYDPNGYSVSAVSPSNLTLETWQSLGCLSGLTSLTFAGSALPLPDAWAFNNSFPALQALNFTNSSLSGTLPASWGQPDAFPELQLLDFSHTQLLGALPAEWAHDGAFRRLFKLQVRDNSISGE